MANFMGAELARKVQLLARELACVGSHFARSGQRARGIGRRSCLRAAVHLLSDARKLGRLPRAFDPRIPHLSAAIAGKLQAPPPAAVDHTKHATAKLPHDLGMMLNNKLLNCTCAAYYHARQVWSFQTTGAAATVPNSDVELLYEQACGFKPAAGGEGPGGVAQHVLRFLHNDGAPLGGGKHRERILAYLEVDPRHIDDVKRTIADCGVAYVGLNIPQNVVPKEREVPALWTVDPKKQKIVEGHAVVLPGYDAEGAIVISWGRSYKMTWEFFSKYVDEVYAIADRAWVDAKKQTPGGLSVPELEALMRYLKD
jgi:hypothetical protein